MNIEEVREYCLSLKNTIECFPFDEVSLVFKVENKMFLLLPLDAEEPHVSLKCSTDYVEELRERYTAVEPAYHFNKKYWNSIYLDRDMDLPASCVWRKPLLRIACFVSWSSRNLFRKEV